MQRGAPTGALIDDLGEMTQQLLKTAPMRMREGSGRRTQTLAELRQQDCIEAVCLGLDAERTREEANASGIDDGDG
jgi:hypothetical protein